MATLKVNTDSVVATAKNIQLCNNQIRDGFSEVQSTITRLDKTWEGEASSTAIAKFNELRSDYCDARYNVLDNYVKFLLNQVGEGYTQTEDANVSLAAQFK